MNKRYDIKILFLHNSIPEYRIPWFQKMNEMSYMKFAFTNGNLVKKLYKYEVDYSKLERMDYFIIEKGIQGYKYLKFLLKNIKNYDYVELPPVDSVREFWISYFVAKCCKSNKIAMGYFWEKWEAPKGKQPFKRKLKNRILGTAAKFIYKRADIIFAGGSLSKKYFINHGINKEKICVLPDTSEVPACEFVDLRKKYNIGKRIILLYFGRIIEEKGLDYLIRAFLKVKDSEKYYLMIVGDGNFRMECEKLAKELIIENICFVGQIHPDNRANYFSQCDVFVFPGTYYQGGVDVWGLTINEAIQHGKIVISTKAVGSANDLIIDGVNGYLLEAENVDELTKAIEKTNNQELKEYAIIKNRELIKIYSYDAMANIYIKTVNQYLYDRKRI